MRFSGFERISACNIKVGHLVKVEANQRVPADLVFVRTSEKGGSCFIRTDQLDGETDWKIRQAPSPSNNRRRRGFFSERRVSTSVAACCDCESRCRRAIHFTQQLPSLSSVSALDAQVHAEPPRQDIYEFVGKFVCFSPLKTGGRGSLRDGDGNSSEIKSLPLGAPSEAAEIEAFEEPPKSAAAEASSSQSPSTGAGEGDSVVSCLCLRVPGCRDFVSLGVEAAFSMVLFGVRSTWGRGVVLARTWSLFLWKTFCGQTR